jgi:hypothetical protein
MGADNMSSETPAAEKRVEPAATREMSTAPATRRMGVDVLGCVRGINVHASNAFLPVFEAVVNSIHATEDRFGKKVGRLGKVDVHVHRVQQESLPGVGRPPVLAVTGFTITDNGTGFSDANLTSFETAHTTAKAARGGRGLGRFSWLVVFREALVDSTFDRDKARVQRRFAFRPTVEGVEDRWEGPAEPGSDLGTSVHLKSVKHQRYEEPLRRGSDVVAELLFEHCFHYFVIGPCPRIVVVDHLPDGETRLEVNDKTKELSITAKDLRVGVHDLEVLHVQQRYRTDRHHEAHLCAHRRVVTSFALSKCSDLDNKPIPGKDGEPAVHHVFVSGKVLDESVDRTRTGLDLPEDEPISLKSGGLDLKSLRQAIGVHVNEELAPILKAEREENMERVSTHIRTIQPEYRHLLSHVPEQIARVKWTDDRAQLDEALYRVQQAWEQEIRRKQAEVEAKLDQANVTDPEGLAEQIYKIVSEVNEAGQANLVRYVAKRRAVLTLINKLMSARSGPALEEDIHKIVLPLRKTGDEVQYTDHNLWLVDETLSFYEYIASDISFAKNKKSPSASKRRPDILAFKSGDPFQHVAIVEFKRPDRDDEDPVKQLVDYTVLLRDGGKKDVHGVTLPGIPRSVRIDAYAVVSLTPAMKQLLRVSPGNMTAVDGEDRWYGSLPAENLYVEVLDYRAFVRRAEQRNRAFFTRLGLT